MKRTIILTACLALAFVSCKQPANNNQEVENLKKEVEALEANQKTDEQKADTKEEKPKNTTEVKEEANAKEAPASKKELDVKKAALSFKVDEYVGVLGDNKYFFYNTPNLNDRTKTYCVQGDYVDVHSVSSDKKWVYVSYISANGQSYYGYMKNENIRREDPFMGR